MTYRLNKKTVSHILIDRGMRQRDLAAAIRVTPAYMSCLMLGKKSPGLGTALDIAKALGVDLKMILEEVE